MSPVAESMRIHIIAYNLRPVVIRQGAEIMMQVAFLEVALSYLYGQI